MLARIIGVFKLDAENFEQIEADSNLTFTAALIVALVGLVSGLGNGLFNGFIHKTFLGGFIGALVSVLLGWLLWSAVTWIVGTRFFHGEADLGQMLRVVGFAYLPLVLSIIPCVGGIIGIVWTFAAVFIAVRQGLDLDDMRTFLTVMVGALSYVVLTGILNLFFL